MCYNVSMDREQIVATATRIAELRKEITKLGTLQKELRQLENQLDSVSGVTPAAAPARRRSGSSIEDRVAQFLEEGADREWTPEEIAEKLDVHLPTVRASLSKLRKSARIIDTRKGHVQIRKAEPESPKEEDKRLTLVA
jgi:DNA-directed RNA polymerase specialized sigma24 family protein